MVRTSKDCHSFPRHLLKVAVIQVLLSTLEAKPRHSLFLSHVVSLRLHLWLRAPPVTCMALTVTRSEPNLAPEEALIPLGEVKKSKVIAGNRAPFQSTPTVVSLLGYGMYRVLRPVWPSRTSDTSAGITV